MYLWVYSLTQLATVHLVVFITFQATCYGLKTVACHLNCNKLQQVVLEYIPTDTFILEIA
jgi:hypothetical protein